MREAAEALKLTAQDLFALGVCDRIIPEPIAGAQRHRLAAVDGVRIAISGMLAEVQGMDRESLRIARRQKYLTMGSRSLVE